MKKNNIQISGFVNQNNGEIRDCYTEMKLKGKKEKIFGFSNHNNGEISNSYSNSKIKKKKCLGFMPFEKDVMQGLDDIEDQAEKIKAVAKIARGNFYNYSNVKHKKNDKQEKENDPYARYENEITKDFLNLYDWDLENTWNLEHEIPEFEKKDNKYFYIIEASEEEKIISIKSADQLRDIVKKINEGDKDSANAHYRLEKNIDLEGKKWIPIGCDVQTPFRGKFDGNGYKIFNFKISDNKLMYTGFFGVVNNAVIANLQLDGILKKGNNLGGFVSYNENSIISCCDLVTRIKNKNAAAFVYVNSGVIERCHVKGYVDIPLIILLPLTAIVAGVIVGAALVLTPKLKKVDVLPSFPEIPKDKYSEEAETEKDQSDAEHNVTLKFKKDIVAATGKSIADVYIGSPNILATNYLVVTLQITDKTLQNTIGKTGRTQKDQKKLDAMGNYDQDLYRVEVGKSGAIYPGYQISKLQMKPLPDGTVLPAGEYDAVILFEFYDLESNLKSSLNSQTAVKLVVEG